MHGSVRKDQRDLDWDCKDPGSDVVLVSQLLIVDAQVTPLAHNIQRIPYPIPPAGADPDTYRSEEEPPPLGFTYPFMPNIVLLDNPIQVSPRGPHLPGCVIGFHARIHEDNLLVINKIA